LKRIERSSAIPEADSAKQLENSLGMKFVLIHAGEFIMGLPDAGNENDVPPECPAHRVRISRPYYLASHEVMQRDFARIMAHNPSYHQTGELADAATDCFPVEQVTWLAATEFCQKLSQLPPERAAGRQYRLPTEAEWEYACRCGSIEPYSSRQGRKPEYDSGDAIGIEPALPIKPVGSFSPNAFGLYDMRGNVWEWCADWFDRDYYSRSPA
jgi:formylglycine-generating enzyme required for sulfatase activity